MTTKDRILLESKAWRQEKLNLDPQYFTRLNEMHNPKILWISSSDSLASIREMTNTEPGDIIVYRNIGSQVRMDDLSLMAVLEDAVEIDHVSHIILCGYSHCSGIRDVILGNDVKPALREWLKDVRKLYEQNYDALKDLPLEKQEKALSEMNIKKQILNLSRIPCIQKAWEKGDQPVLHGWYFDIVSGTLQEVFSMEENHRIKQTSQLTEDSVQIKSMAS